jgi:hypothetical protein
LNNYLSQTVTAIATTGSGYRIRATFSDGFTGEVDLAPLLGCGPIFESLRDPAFFRRVKVSSYGVPEWSDELDLSPGSLRAWCEAGQFMDYEQTDAWIAQHSPPREKVA